MSGARRRRGRSASSGTADTDDGLDPIQTRWITKRRDENWAGTYGTGAVEVEERTVDFESIDVDELSSAVHQLRQISDLSVKKSKANLSKARRWLFLCGVAVFTSLAAVVITWAARLIMYLKFIKVVNPLIESEMAGSRNLGVTCMVYIAFNLVLVILACFTVIFGARIAAGSGIPEVRCWLNGVKIKYAVRVKTLAMKVLGVIGASASGLPVGKEGPMIHSGAVVGAGISQGKTTIGKWSKVDKFRNDKAKLDFIACGAAAGVSAAFGAPIGGVLFCLEEGASWWHPNLTTQTFFCTILACFLSTLIMSGVNEEGFWDSSGFATNLSAPGTFATDKSLQFYYHWWDLPMFVCIGVIGGFAGALFNFSNHKILLWRMKHIHSSRCRSLLEAMCISVLVSLVAFGLPLFFGECVPMPPEDRRIEGTSFVTFYCSDEDDQGQYYNQLATLTFTGFESAIKQLFYFSYSPEVASTIYYTAFSDATLGIAFVFFSFLTCITFGLGVPAGVFVPSLMCGALMGRLFGQLYDGALQGYYDNHYNASGAISNFTVDPGVYAVVGAASMLGGVTHMVISLTVIVVECTNGLNLALPIMFALFVAKWVSSRFGHGLYDRYIDEKRVSFLEWSAPKYFHHLLTQDVMKKDPICLRQVEKVERIFQILCNTKCHGFPVIIRPAEQRHEPPADLNWNALVKGKLSGIMLRNHLLVLLSKRAIETVRYPASERPAEVDVHSAKLFEKFLTDKRKLVGFGTLEKTYPRYPDIADIRDTLTPEQRNSWIDLSPYMGIPYTDPAHAPLMRTFKVFRHLGLRHMVITDESSASECEAVGMVTRRQLDHVYTAAIFKSIYGSSASQKKRCCPCPRFEEETSPSRNSYRVGSLSVRSQPLDFGLQPATEEHDAQEDDEGLLGNSIGESGMELRASVGSVFVPIDEDSSRSTSPV